MAEKFNKGCLKDLRRRRICETNGARRMIGKDKNGTRTGSQRYFARILECSADPDDTEEVRTSYELSQEQQESLPRSRMSFMQWIAMLIAQKSNWNVLKDLEEKGAVRARTDLLNLNLGQGNDTDMDNPKYACAM